MCRLLNAHRVRYLVAGGVAANLHGSVRATKDVDVLVPVDRANMERLLEALAELPSRVASELDPDEMLRKPITIIGYDPRETSSRSRGQCVSRMRGPGDALGPFAA